MKKNKLYLLLALAAALLAGCSPLAPYKTKNVVLDLQITDLSAGYAAFTITPSTDTYYYFNIIELDSGQTAPAKDDAHFMTLQLDQANIDYLKWRHDLLEKKVPYIASFLDHTLYYGAIKHTVVHLIPGYTYCLYAFVVDPVTVKPVGNLFTKTFTTTDSSYKKIAFDYRIDDWWDFVYPLDSVGQVYSSHPYMVKTVTEDSLLRYFEYDTIGVANLNKPYSYFMLYMLTYNYLLPDYDESMIEYGVYSASHEYAEFAPDSLVFEPGKTYYTGIFSADGLLNTDQYQIYKFTWHPDLKKTFSHLTDNVGTHW